MHHYKLVIFDWDGTVMDSVARIVSSMQSAAKDLALEIPSAEQVREIIGLSLPKAAEILFPKLTAAIGESLHQRYKVQYKALDTTPTPLFDNAINLLEQLRQQDKLLAVATGKGRDGLERVWQMTDTKHYFHSSRCGYECQSKPHPEMLEQILAELNVRPEEAVMIGDTRHDMAMAKNANVDRIGVTYGVDDKITLAQYQPKAIVDSLFELQDLLL
ncbi:haloacid dehalogenase [Thalassotalea insulae]|uniref:Haloacid dehalogenase n=1 Tax=Thalassotalea insulae TaxID=2056778 RepID=A0ABQ6GMB3_9GAMM|nr:HAD-IA family hydrolase [Thalassotalea insulae]GLX76754.1 haloacid dehalogenase [Thalassotalea insulae]